MNTEQTFAYSVSTTAKILVASMSGKLSHASLHEFQSFEDEVLSVPSLRYALFDMSQLSGVTLDGVPGLVHLQKSLRDKGVELKLCGMNEILREKLRKLGVIRSNELVFSLKAALESLKSASAGSANEVNKKIAS